MAYPFSWPFFYEAGPEVTFVEWVFALPLNKREPFLQEVERIRREEEHTHKMAQTLLWVINESPELQELLKNYGKS